MPKDPEYDGYDQTFDFADYGWGIPEDHGQMSPAPSQELPSDVNLGSSPEPRPSGPPAPPEPRPNDGGTDYQAKMKAELGDLYTPGAYEELQHRDFDPGWYDRIVNKEQLRANNEPGSTYHEDGKGGYLTAAPKPVQLRSASNGGGQASGQTAGYSSNQSGPQSMDDIMSTLKGLFPGGAFNQDIVNRRTDNARDALNANRQSTLKNNQAYLAERGLIGSGPEATAAKSLDSRLNSQFNSAYNDIYANESENADQRMIQALSLATGMSTTQAQQIIDQYRATTERDLGFGNLAARNKESDQGYSLGLGNLALGNTRASNDFTLGQGNLAVQNMNGVNNYNLGLAQQGLNRDQLSWLMQSGNIDQLMKLIDQLTNGAGISAGGYI